METASIRLWPPRQEHRSLGSASLAGACSPAGSASEEVQRVCWSLVGADEI